jgi:plastocyanin
VNLQIFTRVKKYTSFLVIGILFSSQALAWEVDLSRRQKDLERNPASAPQAVIELPVPGFIKDFIVGEKVKGGDIVIMNTDKGFVPNQVQVTAGESYTIHVVNVNENEKNISFILDSFAQHFGTFYGKSKSFTLEASAEGVYTFISPEVAAEGKIVVTKPATTPNIKQPEVENRLPASE